MKFPKYCAYCGYPLPIPDAENLEAGELMCPECEGINIPEDAE